MLCTNLTLSAFQRSIDWHLIQYLKKTYSILRDLYFTSSRQALKGSRKYLRAQGKGNKPNASDGLQSCEIERLWDSGALGDGDPQTLRAPFGGSSVLRWEQEAVMSIISFVLGTLPLNNRPTDQSMLSCVVNEAQRHALGRQRNTNGDARSFNPKMRAALQRTEHCPVRLYRLFATKRPPEMCKPESPFYLAINCKHTIRSHWFKAVVT